MLLSFLFLEDIKYNRDFWRLDRSIWRLAKSEGKHGGPLICDNLVLCEPSDLQCYREQRKLAVVLERRIPTDASWPDRQAQGRRLL